MRDGRTVLRYSERACATSSSCVVFTQLFGRDQVLVLIYDDFRVDNEATIRRVLRFLEVDDGVAITRSRPTRPFVCARCAWRG